MRTYMAPVIEYIELRTEESLACIASTPISVVDIHKKEKDKDRKKDQDNDTGKRKRGRD